MRAAFTEAVVVITGAGSGIGRAVALRFAGLGAEVVIADIDPARLSAVQREIAEQGGRARSVEVDVGSLDAMAAFADRVHTELGKVDILINNAGVGLMCQVKDMSIEEWEWVMRVNYWGVVHGIHVFLPRMLARRAGHIVNIASANGLFAFPFGGAYASTKFAIVGLSEALRAELKRFGIGVTVVCPGLTRTSILRDGRMKPDGEQSRRFLEQFTTILDRRGVDPQVIARAIPAAVRRNKAIVKVPFHVRAVDAVHRFAPSLYRWAIAQVIRGNPRPKEKSLP